MSTTRPGRPYSHQDVIDLAAILYRAWYHYQDDQRARKRWGDMTWGAAGPSEQERFKVLATAALAAGFRPPPLPQGTPSGRG